MENDGLGDISEKTHLIMHYCSVMEVALGSYGSALLKVFMLSAEENDFLTLSLYEDSGSSEEDLTVH